MDISIYGACKRSEVDGKVSHERNGLFVEKCFEISPSSPTGIY